MPTDPTPVITTLDALDEVLAELREPRPSEPPTLPNEQSPGGEWYGYATDTNPIGLSQCAWAHLHRPTRNADDTLAMLEWFRSRGGVWNANSVEDEAVSFSAVVPHERGGVFSHPDFRIAASVAVARACGLKVELKDSP